MKYPFTKTRFRLKFPGLAGKMCIANFKQNKLLRYLFLRNKTKDIQTKINNVYLNTRLWLRQVCQAIQSLQISTSLSECKNKEKSKKILLKNIGKINILTPFVTSQISTWFQREQPISMLETSHVIISFLSSLRYPWSYYGQLFGNIKARKLAI